MVNYIPPWNGSYDVVGRMNGINISDLLSERSQKFYNGTYQWNSDGFVDDQGVYRKFSDESIAQPPTPFPPAYLSVTGDDLQLHNLLFGFPVTDDFVGSRVFDQEDISGPPATDLSDAERADDPDSCKLGDIQKGGEESRGAREAASTPVNAPASTLSDPVGPSALRAEINELKKEKGDDDDEDDDEEKRKNSSAKSDHGGEKVKKRKRDDEDDEDDVDKKNDGAIGGKKDTTAQDRKDSKAMSTRSQSRKKSTVVTNTASNVASGDTEKLQTSIEITTDVIVSKGKGKGKRMMKDAAESLAKRPLTSRQYAIEQKKKVAETNTAGIPVQTKTDQ